MGNSIDPLSEEFIDTFFDNKEWLQKNEETPFVKRFRNAAGQLQMQIDFGGIPGSGNTYAFGVTDEGLWETIRHQFTEAINENLKLTGDDRKEADEAIKKFRVFFKDSMKFLE